jgi:hypothetical protein
VRFLDIDLNRPDFQTLRAAQELIDDNQPILVSRRIRYIARDAFFGDKPAGDSSRARA